MKYILLTACIITCFASPLSARNSTLKGIISDTLHKGIHHATITIRNPPFAKSMYADKQGHYEFSGFSEGDYTIEVKFIGYKIETKTITMKNNNIYNVNFTLKENSQLVNEVNIEAKTESREIKESGYDINVIETKQIENRSIDINPFLSRTAGVRVRESGGLGSDFSYSLNGMSGRSIRFYVDGVPIDRYGAGYGINNFPVNLIERIEIFK